MPRDGLVKKVPAYHFSKADMRPLWFSQAAAKDCSESLYHNRVDIPPQ